LLGRALAALFPPEAHGYVTRFFVATFGSFVTAATVAILYLLTRALGYRGRVALGLAGIYALATTAWPHGRTFLAEPLDALLLLACFYAIVRGLERLRIADCGLRIKDGTPAAPPHRGLRQSAIRNPQSAIVWLILSGAAATAAVATKPHAVIALPFLGLYLLWGAARVPEARSAGWGSR